MNARPSFPTSEQQTQTTCVTGFRGQNRGYATALAAILGLAVVSAGCATQTAARQDEGGQEYFPATAEVTRVVLEPGDQVEIKFVMTPEMDDLQTIRPDGRISLPYLQDVMAAGLTPAELQQRLEQDYAPELREPKIVVIVRELAQQRVYVGGQVLEPGLYPLQGRLSALEAVMLAGGFNENYAKRNSVVVVRQEGGKRYSQALDLRKSLKEDEIDPFILQPNDIVYVPETVITKVDRWVEQYLEKLVPSDVFFAIRTIDELTEDDDLGTDDPLFIPSTGGITPTP